MDGDDLSCIADNGETYPYDDLNPAHCLGHVVHELGHVFGLAHTGPNDDCMRWGFYDDTGTPRMCFFDDANRAQILAEPANAGFLTEGNGVACGDQQWDCPILAAAGACTTDPAFMLDTCAASCGVCTGERCVDEHPVCATWAAAGECTINPNYMLAVCSDSCGVCGTGCADADGDRVCDPHDQCLGNDAVGDADADGICEPRVRVSNARPGALARIEVTDALPGGDVFVVGSALGDDGPSVCHPTGATCSTLVRPTVLGQGTADAAGAFTLQLPIPASSPVQQAWVQAGWVTGWGAAISAVEPVLPGAVKPPRVVVMHV
jgi:hypothetical protein